MCSSRGLTFNVVGFIQLPWSGCCAALVRLIQNLDLFISWVHSNRIYLKKTKFRAMLKTELQTASIDAHQYVPEPNLLFLPNSLKRLLKGDTVVDLTQMKIRLAGIRL